MLARLVAAVVASVIAVGLSLVMLDQALAAGEPGSAANSSSQQSKVSAASAAPTFVVADAVPYGDCTGAAPLGHTAVYRDSCLPGIYLLAHNPGPFTPILALRVGSKVSYGNRTYTITRVTRTTPAAQWVEGLRHPAALTLQTCADGSGPDVWVFIAS